MKCTVLGRTIGECSGWDQADDWSILMLDFIPSDLFGFLTADSIEVHFDKGTITGYDVEGNVVHTADIIETLRNTTADSPA